MGAMSRGYSRGSYSRSASWTTAMSPVMCAIAVRTAAPLPWLRSWCTTTRRNSGSSGTLARYSWRIRVVPSVEQSSTTTTSFVIGTARTRSSSVRTVPASLYTGTRTDRRVATDIEDAIVAGGRRDLKEADGRIVALTDRGPVE